LTLRMKALRTTETSWTMYPHILAHPHHQQGRCVNLKSLPAGPPPLPCVLPVLST
jgi:hypothetical protein